MKAAPADGSTFLPVLDYSVVIVPVITPTAGYDALKDFVPVAQVARFQWTLAVPQGSPAKTLAEFVDTVRKDPSQGNWFPTFALSNMNAAWAYSSRTWAGLRARPAMIDRLLAATRYAAFKGRWRPSGHSSAVRWSVRGAPSCVWKDPALGG